MLLLRLLTVASCFALSVLCVHAQETDLKDILRKAIKAHGGEQNLAKYKAGSAKFKGTMELMEMKVPIDGESTLQKPDKLKIAMNLDINGKIIPIIQVFNGKQLWVSVLGKTQEVKDEKLLNEMRETLSIEGADGLIEFVKAPYELSALGEVKIKGQNTIGIRVSKKGQRDISLFFDKKTHLLAKTEMRTLNAMNGQEVTQEKFMTEYQEVNGLKMARRVLVHNDDKWFMEMEITEAKMFDKLDVSLFAMP